MLPKKSNTLAFIKTWVLIIIMMLKVMAKLFTTKKLKASRYVWIQGQSQRLKDSNDTKPNQTKQKPPQTNKLWDLSCLPFISSETAIISWFI